MTLDGAGVAVVGEVAYVVAEESGSPYLVVFDVAPVMAEPAGDPVYVGRTALTAAADHDPLVYGGYLYVPEGGDAIRCYLRDGAGGLPEPAPARDLPLTADEVAGRLVVHRQVLRLVDCQDGVFILPLPSDEVLTVEGLYPKTVPVGQTEPDRTVVSVTGTGFDADAQVALDFGTGPDELDAADYWVSDSMSLFFRAPSHATAGPATVLVKNPGAGPPTWVSDVSFEYVE